MAVKIIDKTGMIKRGLIHYVVSEIKIHLKLNHPHITKFVFLAENLSKIFLLIELAENGTLAGKPKKVIFKL